MRSNNKKHISTSQVVIATCIIIILLVAAQFLFMKSFDVQHTGPFGDTIGGITAPLINLLSAYLIYKALKEQIDANSLLSNQLRFDKIESELKEIYYYLDSSIINFRFSSLPLSDMKYIRNIDIDYVTGPAAFDRLLDNIFCRHYTKSFDELMALPSVSEFYSILKTLSVLLDKINKIELDDNLNQHINWNVYKNLTIQLFEYKLIPRHRGQNYEDLLPQFCSKCNCDHGLPKPFIDLIKEINEKIK